MGNVRGTKHRVNPLVGERVVNARVRVVFLKCPLCGLTQAGKFYGEVKPGGRGEIRFGREDLESLKVLTVREGGGYRSGFSGTGEGKTLVELKNDSEYARVVSDLKSACERIIKVLSAEKAV